jgi:hypothetical protein
MNSKFFGSLIRDIFVQFDELIRMKCCSKKNGQKLMDLDTQDLPHVSNRIALSNKVPVVEIILHSLSFVRGIK